MNELRIFEGSTLYVLVAVGLVLVALGALRFELHRRRVIALTTVPLDAAAGFVQSEGQVTIGPKGALRAPISGGACVWYRVTIDAELAKDAPRWRTVHQEVQGEDFVLRAPSTEGEGTAATPGTPAARVVPRRAEVRWSTPHVVTLDHGDEPTTALAEYVMARGATIPEIRESMPAPGAIRFIEEAILLGQSAWVAGTARKEGSETVFDGALYLADQNIATLAASGRLWDGPARPA